MTTGIRRTAGRILGLCLALAMAGSGLLSAQAERTQTFELQPGWNAVYLEVRPDPNDAESVFGGLPLASAWTWNPRVGKVEFIDDPDERLIASPAWQGYFPRPRPESILTNLFAVQGNRAYLLKIEGSAPVVWSVTGRPEVQRPAWVPDSFNLAGFFVDPAIPVSFATFLAPSEAHSGQPVFRLIGGVWQQVPPSTQIRSGEAYWVYCQGPSSYSGPLEVDLDGGKAMEFGGGVDGLRMRVRNLAGYPVAARLAQLGSSSPVPLSIFRFDPDTGELAWPSLPANLALPVDDGGELMVDLAPRRAELTAPVAGSLLEVRDGFGFRRFVAVTAKSAFAPPEYALRRGESALARFFAKSNNPFAGLWVGSVMLRRVSQAQTGSLTTTPVDGDFRFRILVHIDAVGTARLLKEVIQLWKEGTRIPDPENPGMLIVDEPGYFVLLTDDSLIPQFEGATLRDGEPVGYRISTVAYDFEPQSVVMSGSFGLTGSLAVVLSLDATDGTNPFLHRYHPDHNNLDERYLGFVEEAFAVTRNISLEFSSQEPFGRSLPTYGESTIGGTYRELISGLHRNDIAVEGPFLLRRVSARPTLNQ
jgi:hypothetical protein